MKSIRFLHMSDLHFLEAYPSTGFAAEISRYIHPKENIKCALQSEANSNIDFILLTGDLSHEGQESDYRALRNLFKNEAKGIPIVSLPGNHDIPAAYSQGFLNEENNSNLNRVYYLAGLKIITLDSGREDDGVITVSQAHWLKEQLESDLEKRTLLALHHPLKDNQNGLPCSKYPKELIEIIEKSNILGIFCGHTHSNYVSSFAGKPYFTANSMSFSFTGINGALEYEKNASYNIFELNSNELSLQIQQAACKTNKPMSADF